MILSKYYTQSCSYASVHFSNSPNARKGFFFFKTYAYKDRRMKVNIKAIKVFNLESG